MMCIAQALSGTQRAALMTTEKASNIRSRFVIVFLQNNSFTTEKAFLMTEEGSAGKHPSCGAVFSCARVSSVRSTVSTRNSFGRYEWKGRSSGSGISALLLLPVCTPTVDVYEAELVLNGGGPAWSFTISLFSQMQECIRAPCHFLLLYHTESVKATALDKNDTTKAQLYSPSKTECSEQMQD